MPGTLSSVLSNHDIVITEDELAHYGKAGMKWGVRKGVATSGRTAASTTPAKPKAKDLSDDELKTHINRLKLEKEYTKLSAPEINRGRKIVGDLLLDVGKKQAADYLNREIGKAIAIGAAKAAAKAAARAVT